MDPVRRTPVLRGVGRPRLDALPRRTVLGGLGALAAGALVGCTSAADPVPSPSPSPAGSAAVPSPSAAATTPSATPTPTPTPSPTGPTLPPVTDPVSLAALMRERIAGSAITRGTVENRTAAYTRYRVTYRVGPVTVSGILLVPTGRGPFPGVVLNHGYFPVSTYYSGQGLPREQDRLAREGYVVLHTDYRGHAGSSEVSALERELRLGYARDSIAAVSALKQEDAVDPDRVVMLGRSMGGGVTYNALVTAPGIVRAAVVYAPVSSDFVDNLRRWTIPGRSDVVRELYAEHGSPEDAPFYAGISPRAHFGRITEPMLIHHGTNDEQCPIAWTRETQQLLTAAGVRSTLQVYEGERHTFSGQWERSMQRTLAFFEQHLG